MLHDVIRASYVKDYEIELEFDDGQGGIVDFSRYLKKGGVFERFKDIDFFRNFLVNEDLGTITWGDEVDISPEILYAEATGSPLPDWMDIDIAPSANNSLQPTS